MDIPTTSEYQIGKKFISYFHLSVIMRGKENGGKGSRENDDRANIMRKKFTIHQYW